VRLTHMTRYVVAAGAVAAPLAICAPAAAATGSGFGSAYALAATGPVKIAPVSLVPATSAQQPTRRSLVELPPNSVVEASALNAAAWAGHGRASVADLKVYKALLTASVINAKCENKNAVAHLTEAVLNGKKLAVTPRPNTTIAVPNAKTGALPQLVKVILNKQVHNADGSLTVTAIELSVSLAGKTETISIASATCGRKASGHPGGPESGPPTGPAAPAAPSAGTDTSGSAGAAPAPTPVAGDLPVTG
jgi:hypothetical protein